MILITIPDGRLCAEPRINDLPSGARVANVRVASNYRVKDGEEWVSEGMFFDAALYRGVDTLATYFTKGSPIVIFGQLQEREWTDRDGNQRKSLEIARADWAFPPKSAEDGPQNRPAAQPQAKAQPQVAAAAPAAAGNDGIPW